MTKTITLKIFYVQLYEYINHTFPLGIILMFLSCK